MNDKNKISSQDSSNQHEFTDPLAHQIAHEDCNKVASLTDGLSIASLDLAEHAKSSAEKLKRDFPTVVFTSGRRNVERQASAMAGNVVANRKWIEQTYRQSSERNQLQKWVDDNPQATTKQQITIGLKRIMQGWSDAQRERLSRHFAGLAFDVRPTSDTNLKQAIRSLPNLVRFLDSEGGITIWHAEFRSK